MGASSIESTQHNPPYHWRPGHLSTSLCPSPLTGCGLVEEDDGGVHHQLHSDGAALSLPARHAADHVRADLGVGAFPQAQQLDGVLHPALVGREGVGLR